MTLYIELTAEQEEALRRLAEKTHQSVEEMVRESLQRLLHESAQANWESRKTRALNTVGRFRSGKRDVSEQHDQYLMEAYGIMGYNIGQGVAMKPPLIGITTGYEQHNEPVVSLGQRYIRAVERAGGVPVTLAPLREQRLVERYAYLLDGLIISGGRDIPPALYGEEAHPQTDALCEERPQFEIALVRLFRELDKPVLGICYGCQLLNVAFGGTLIQDIPSQIGDGLKHRRASAQEPHARHIVNIREGSLLHRFLGTRQVEIVSSHHQAVKQPAPCLQVTATAPDGVVEAIELEDARFFVGVQWHPEMDPEAEATHRLMYAFVRAASEATMR